MLRVQDPQGRKFGPYTSCEEQTIALCYRVTSLIRRRTHLGPYSSPSYSPAVVLRGGVVRVAPRAENPGYKGTSLIRNDPPLGPYFRTMTGALRWSQGGRAVSYE